ncbi:Bug family tripartite tricarboxylate transporter substrate binding protein [Rhodoplanes sp. Z2-YC6860]|uniref:Bug family tripartite tricarboxylate transporter substrate binding protein n=1 Tax=Rhodoplanes sp. Z2-YC6860 TaxID=674703 RepID=UPI00083166DB|nr:tripartite tricarboxylate transporter substrate binding protein [Rhodoplanes sp. Z2-YC6860]
MQAVRFIALVLGLVCGPLLGVASAVEKFPNRPIKFVVGFLAGGPNDIVARVFCEWLQQHLGQPCVVENRAGQGGMIAAKAVMESPADGYTIMFVAPNNAIGQTLYKSLPFNFVRDTTPIAGIAQLTNIMVVPPDLPVKTVADFIAYAKANPGKVTQASSGNGTSVHMSGELFKMMTHLDILHVPYRGSSAIYPDLMTGKVHVLFDNLPGSVEFVKTGKLRALGVTTAKRSEVFPDLPAIGETVPGYEASVFYGVSGPKGIPADVVEVLNKAFNAALADPKMQQRVKELGGEPMPMAPEQFGKLVSDETEKWGKVVKAANISIE